MHCRGTLQAWHCPNLSPARSGVPEGTKSDDFPSTHCSHRGAATLLRSRAASPELEGPTFLWPPCVPACTHVQHTLEPCWDPSLHLREVWQPRTRSCLSGWTGRVLTTSRMILGKASPGLQLLILIQVLPALL